MKRLKDFFRPYGPFDDLRVIAGLLLFLLDVILLIVTSQ